MTNATRLAVWIALATFVLYALTACPTVPFGDGGELIAAGFSFGVAHPPGYPLYTTLGWLALKLPLGEPAFRMNLLSALFGGLTCGAVAWLLVRATGSRVGAAAGALALAVSSTFWSVATVTEVYTLHLFLMTVTLCAALTFGSAPDGTTRGRALLAGSIALGLGLAHHPTIAVALPAAAILASRPSRNGSRWNPLRFFPSTSWGWIGSGALAMVALPVVAYGSLMMRARANPAANWGNPTTLDALAAHAGASIYRHMDLGWSAWVRPEGWKTLIELAAWEFTPLLLPVAAIGLAGWPAAAGHADRRRHAAGVAVLIAAGVAFGLRYSPGDSDVFYLPVFLGLALAAGLGLAQLHRSERLAWRRAGLVAAALAVFVPAALHLPARNLRDANAAYLYAQDVLDTVEAGGVLFVDSDDAFPVMYLHQVLGRRPDITVYDRMGHLFRDLAKEPGPLPRVADPGRAQRIHIERTFIAREMASPRPRGIYFLGWPGYEVPPRYRLEPLGLCYRVAHASEPIADDGPVWAGYHAEAVRTEALRTGDDFAKGIAAIYPMARAERALFLGNRAEADAALEESAALGGDLNYIGTLYGRFGDFARAVEMFERVIEINPAAVGAWNNLAIARERSGDIEGAKEALRRSLRLQPEQADIRGALRRLE